MRDFILMDRKIQDNLAAIFICIFAFGLYLNSLGNVFIFDDIHSISENIYIKDLRYIPLFFKGDYTPLPYIPRGMFRPFVLLTIAFNYAFSGLNPLGYHIINILLHFVNGVLFYCLLRLLKKDIPFGLSLMAALLFVSHPLNTEAVSYIICRSDLLLALFILSGLIFYLKGKMIPVILLYVCAMLTKETALIFPALIFICDFFILKPFKQPCLREDKIKKYIFYFWLIGISVLYLAYRSIIFASGGGTISGLAGLNMPLRSHWSNILIQSVVSLFYLRLFVYPYPLTIHHSFPNFNSLFDAPVLFSVAGLVILVSLVFILRKKQPLISFGLAWYLICIAPKFYALLHIVSAEHHFYLPGFGVYMALGIITERLYSDFRRNFTYIAVTAIGIFAVLTWFRNYEWKDSLTLWRSASKIDSSSAVAHHGLGSEYLNMGLYNEAEAEFKKALEFSAGLDNVERNARENLANIYRLRGNFKEALEEINESIRLKPNDFSSYQNLGVVYLDMGEEAKAEETWKKGLGLYPFASGIDINLGLLYLRKGRLKEAKDYFQAAIQADPDGYLAYSGLAQVCEQESDIKSAIRFYEKTLQLSPAFIFARSRLGELYARQGNYSLAFSEYREVVKMVPNFAEGYNNLAVICAAMKPPQLESAKEYAKKAISLGYKVKAGFLRSIGLDNAGERQ